MPLPHSGPPRFGLVAVASSAGGLQVLSTLLRALPDDFPAPVVVAQHRAAGRQGWLDQILARRTRLRVREAADGDVLRGGTVYVGPTDRHVRVHDGGVLRLGADPRVNFARPAADPLFHSAARVLGPRVLGVVLTGRGRDGAAGAAAIRRGGGVVLVQDPATCVAPSMPLTVLAGCGADFVLSPRTLAHALVSLVMTPSVSTALFGLPLAASA